ncbi:MAG: hypothetical protein HY664_06410 [Chloroflexi bacterium]|nr:hypothetical protein [Chloroflexota bacterium]
MALARRHWLYLYPRLILAVLEAVIPAAFLVGLVVYTDRFEGLPRTVILVISALWLLYWAVRIYFIKYRYDNDIWVITDQRLVDSTKNHWFHLHISTTDLVDIQDMTITRSGILRTLFNFGDIECQTAGTVRNFSLTGIPKPAELHSLVDRLRDQARVAPNKSLDTSGKEAIS